jgi:hypothetical protein
MQAIESAVFAATGKDHGVNGKTVNTRGMNPSLRISASLLEHLQQ